MIYELREYTAVPGAAGGDDDLYPVTLHELPSLVRRRAAEC